MDTSQVHTQDFQRMAASHISLVLIKANPTRPFLPLSNQRQAYILMYFLSIHLQPMCDQAHPVQLWQPYLQKCKHGPCYLLGSVAPGIPGSFLSLGKQGYQVRDIFFKIGVLNVKHHHFSPHTRRAI